MEAYKFQLIETAVVLLLLIVGSRVSKRLIEQAGVKFSYHKTRIKIVKKITTIVLYLLAIGILLLVWGIAPSELAAYLASLFTVVGIAFLAQWSIISNITSTLIIFFNHQVNIGDSVVVLDKDYSVSGKISDIGLFFIIIKVETDEYVSIPSNVFMQKMVKKVVK
ncbi:MAG: mechanosensitive ion channel family protein [Spirosomaceae bacterium]|nr:mechanosensitive ion channel family protein [Spirosomataceae bacterium]